MVTLKQRQERAARRTAKIAAKHEAIRRAGNVLPGERCARCGTLPQYPRRLPDGTLLCAVCFVL